MPRIIFVSGFHPSTRARDLAYEFERYGPLVRCDVPAPRNPRAHSNPYAFVEFRSTRDAEDAYNDMHGRNLDGHRLSIQWAKNPPSSVWRYDRDRRSPPPAYRSRDRSRSPRRRSEREKERPDDRDRDRDRDRDHRDDRDRRRRTRSPAYERRRTPSPDRRAVKERVDDRARTPPPPDDMRKEDTKAVTPPYDR